MSEPIDLPMGRVLDLPAQEYHDDPGVSRSDLKTIGDYTVAKWKYTPKKPPSVAMNLGTATHLAVFSPDTDLGKSFICAPWVTGYKGPATPSKPNATWDRLAAGEPTDTDLKKDHQVEVVAEAVKAGATLMPHRSLDDVQIIAEAVRSHPVVKDYIAEGVSEVSYFAETVDGIRIKSRDDWETPQRRPTVVDLKTSENGSIYGQQNFWRAIRDYGYDIQRVYYSYVMQKCNWTPRDFEFVVADKPLILDIWRCNAHLSTSARALVASQGVARYRVGQEYWKSGEDLMSRAMDKLRVAEDTGNEGYPRELEWIGTPLKEEGF